MALGLWGTVGAAGAALGPLIGGALLEHFWWGSAFLINVPIMLVVAPLVFLLLPSAEKTTPGTLAMGQTLLLIAGLLAVVYGIKSAVGATHPLVVGLAVALLGFGLLTIFARLQLRSAAPMLDLSLFSRPAILAGIIMAVGATGALAGVELTLAQELQYVLGKTPLQAGVFMMPIMAAAAIGGPVAGYLSNWCGLRPVASSSLLLSAVAMAVLAQADFHQPGFGVPAMLAMLGLTLSIGLTASSIAIMGSVEASKGAAGSLEATAYELGSGLGITIFGVFMSNIFSRAISLPMDLAKPLAERAARSIGDSYVVANSLNEPQGAALIDAAKEAFSAAHTVLLTTSSAMMGILGIVVFIMLSGYKDGE